MKKIICYGDSNTFGFNPQDGSRYGEEDCWPSALQKKLGTEYEVINEGMFDRTGFVDNPNGFLFSGPKYFPHLIKATDKLDYLILWIGTNDLMFQYDITLATIEKGLKDLITLAQSKIRNIIIIPPVILSENILKGYFKCKFDETSIVKSKEAGRIYQKLAKIYNCKYFDVNEVVKPSHFDGLHYDKNSHKIIADKLAQLF